MRIVVIGGSGHIGTFLVPRLVRAGHAVTVISRGSRSAYTPSPEWQQVQLVQADRAQEDAAGTFGDRVAGLNPDVVVDLVCFTLESATALVERLRGETRLRVLRSQYGHDAFLKETAAIDRVLREALPAPVVAAGCGVAA